MSDTDHEGSVVRSLSDRENRRACGRTVSCLADRLGLLLAVARPPERAAVSGEN